MSSHSFGYELEVVVQNYTKYRPTYNSELYESILQYIEQRTEGKGRRGLAVDIGCGPGNSTLPLATYFDRVVGIDSSEAQLNEARRVSVGHQNIDYKLGSAEDLSSLVKDESVDLVTIGTSLHWFDMPRFFQECLRILKPGGAVAAYEYKIPQCENQEANEILHDFFTVTLEKYWEAPTRHYFNGFLEAYDLLKQFLNQCIRDDSMSMKFQCSLSDVVGYIKSLPEYYLYKADHPEPQDDLDKMIQKFKKILNVYSVEDKVVPIFFPMILIMGRKLQHE